MFSYSASAIAPSVQRALCARFCAQFIMQDATYSLHTKNPHAKKKPTAAVFALEMRATKVSRAI